MKEKEGEAEGATKFEVLRPLKGREGTWQFLGLQRRGREREGKALVNQKLSLSYCKGVVTTERRAAPKFLVGGRREISRDDKAFEMKRDFVPDKNVLVNGYIETIGREAQTLDRY